MKRKVYRLHAGSIRRLKISEESIDSLGSQDILIGVKCIGLNFADVFAILGLYSATPDGAFIPGLEVSGQVEAVGDEVTSVSIGDRVMAVTRFGGYTSHLTVDQAFVQPLPDGWTYQDGAGYMVQVLTAWYGLVNLGSLTKGKNVLIHSAAGGVGIWANRICKAMGANTIGTVGGSSKLGLLEHEGYDHGIVRHRSSFAQDLREVLGGQPLDLIMECIGGRIMKIGFEMLAPMGRHIVYGSAQYGSPGDRPNYFKLIPRYLMRPKIDPQNMIKKNKAVMAFNLIYLFEHKVVMRDMLDDLKSMQLGRPIIGHTFSFEALPDAIREFQRGNTVGKVVIEL